MHFDQWREYFIRNQYHFSAIDFDAADKLSPKEKKLITTSIQQFQKGESSEGKHLYAFAKAFEDPSYLQAIRLFIPEEQVHAKVLGAFMKKHGIPPITEHWVDGVFRWLRKIGGISNTVRVLLIAEIIAKVYYRALFHATQSALLRKICAQILLDEEQHIQFQCDALNVFYRDRSALSRFAIHSWQFILMTGTTLVVWLHHRKVLAAGGYSFGRFFSSSLHFFFDAEQLIRSPQSSPVPATI